MTAFYECCVIKYNLFIIRKVTPAARFKTSKSSYSPQIGRWYAVPQHRATMAETVFQKLLGGGG